MAVEVVLSPSAVAWMEAEVEYLAAHNPKAAETFIQRIRRSCELLGRFPNIGQSGEIPGTRRLVADVYVLTTSKSPTGGIEVLAIRHSRQHDACKPNIDCDDGDGAGGSMSGGPK